MVEDVWNLIFAELDFKNYETISLVSKTWCRLVTNPFFLKKAVYAKLAFNAEHWNKYCGPDTTSNEEIENGFNLLNPNIYEFLKTPSAAFPNKKIMDTHILVWIPEKFNGQVLTINTFANTLKLVIAPLIPAVIQEETEKLITPGWILLTKNILPNSRNKSYSEQNNLVQDLNQNNQTNWRVPKLAEIIVCFSAHYLKTGEHLFGHESSEMTYIRCQEAIEDCQLVVRIISPGYHCISYYKSDYEFIAINALYQF